MGMQKVEVDESKAMVILNVLTTINLVLLVWSGWLDVELSVDLLRPETRRPADNDNVCDQSSKKE